MSDQYAELAELAGGFIHEMKNHIGTLGLNLQLLGEDFQDPQTPRERRAQTRIQRLQAECSRLLDLSNDFLRFARIKDLALVPTDLARVVEEMIDFFSPTAQTARIDIKPYLPADLPPVGLDVDLFKQALLNLMLNAEQAMPEGGEITIQAAAEIGSPQSSCSAECHPAPAPPGGPATVCLSLIDTGKGMAPDVLARVFEPFFSTKQGGTGLGLPTTRRIVEAHGGTLTAESAVGRGTRFTIRLPALAARPRPAAPAAEPAELQDAR
jgi:two-component system, NtrC family, sensor histidine kinase HydH